VKIPPGIGEAAPPLNEYFAVRVIGSPSSSIKYPARGIEIDFPWTIEGLGSTLAIIGAALVTVTINVCVKVASNISDTINVIVYTPVSAMDVDATSIWNSAG
jgi:hypothetical protein